MSAPPPRPTERIIPIKVLGVVGDHNGGEREKINITRMGTPSSNGPSIITHHTERPNEEEKGKEGKRNSYLAEEEDIRFDNDDGENCRNLLVTFDDGTTTETQETHLIDRKIH